MMIDFKVRYSRKRLRFRIARPAAPEAAQSKQLTMQRAKLLVGTILIRIDALPFRLDLRKELKISTKASERANQSMFQTTTTVVLVRYQGSAKSAKTCQARLRVDH